LNALVGLTAEKNDVTLPLATWGAGTRRLAALTIADALQGERPITVVDEIEKGLEPYRQRILIKNLIDGGAQVFITTHSASALAAASEAAVWYLDSKAVIGRLPSDKITGHQKSDPDTFLARLAIVCEGDTEVGFLAVLLDRGLGDFVEQGVWVTNGGGHETTLALLEALASGGLCFGGLVDNEKKWPERWNRVKQRLGNLILQWPDGCLEQHVIPLFDETALINVIQDPEGNNTAMRLRSLADRLEIENADIENIKEAAKGNLAELIIEAATGVIPPKFAEAEKQVRNRFKGDAKIWFKSIEGGRELAGKVMDFGAWPKLKTTVMPFLNAIRETIGLRAIEDLVE
jgi:putative ATP-dependent endonuclease of OLD family